MCASVGAPARVDSNPLISSYVVMQRNPPRDLPADLELPLATGQPWWYWQGGRPALDLVNTLRERWNRRVETLVDGDDLALWLVHAELLPEPMPVQRGVLEDARALREAIDRAALAVVTGGRASRTHVAVIDEWLAFAGGRPALTAVDGIPVLGRRDPADSPRRALGMVALDAARMLGLAEERARIRICASDTCSARFYDRSPAGARRWCSMRQCGNVAKARRHRARVGA
jgi:predicted RNA-binding Zn ribbon-like protein